MDVNYINYEKIVRDKHEYRYKSKGKRIYELKILDCKYNIWKGRCLRGRYVIWVDGNQRRNLAGKLKNEYVIIILGEIKSLR